MGGVFINYRSIDNPLGAAAIYEALVSRLGSDHVFRDVSSMEAGTRYPPAIRAALDNADVLVAVIGPQWLTLKDEATGKRLIDRENDWVRWEIERALRRGIHIVPVLLKDTPDNASPPAVKDLPEAIRPLAAIHWMEFSHRRFHEDLEKLVRRLTHLTTSGRKEDKKPTAPRIPAQRGPSQAPPPTHFAKLVDALEAVPSLRTEDTRLLVVSRLCPPISHSIRHYPVRRAHLIEILNRCLDHDDGVAQLIDAIAVLEQQKSTSFRRLVDTFAEFLPERGWTT